MISTLGKSALLQGVKKYIIKNDLLFAGEKVLLAVSGGIDSMVMLKVFEWLANTMRLEVYVAHFNHLLRGEDSDKDANFVAEASKQTGFKFFLGKGDVNKLAKDWKMGIEEAARTARYNFFSRVMSDHDIKMLAVAHNQNDNAETVIFNLLRGSGITGLAGIPNSRNIADGLRLIRPMLGVSREEIENFAKKYDVVWREDKTNLLLDATRNKIRYELMPELKKFNPSVIKTLNTTSEILHGVDEFMGRSVEAILKNMVIETENGRVSLKIPHLKYLPKALQAEVLQRVISKEYNIKPVDFSTLKRISDLMLKETGSQIDVVGGVIALKDRENLVFIGNTSIKISGGKKLNNQILAKHSEENSINENSINENSANENSTNENYRKGNLPTISPKIGNSKNSSLQKAVPTSVDKDAIKNNQQNQNKIRGNNANSDQLKNSLTNNSAAKNTKHNPQNISESNSTNKISVPKQVPSKQIVNVVKTNEPQKEINSNDVINQTNIKPIDGHFPIMLKFENVNILVEKVVKKEVKFAPGTGIEYIDAENLHGEFKLRKWNKGDKFVPLGMTNEKKLSDFFIDLKIPLDKKGHIMVLINSQNGEEKIIWICGHRINNQFRITRTTTHALKLSMELTHKGKPTAFIDLIGKNIAPQPSDLNKDNLNTEQISSKITTDKPLEENIKVINRNGSNQSRTNKNANTKNTSSRIANQNEKDANLKNKNVRQDAIPDANTKAKNVVINYPQNNVPQLQQKSVSTNKDLAKEISAKEVSAKEISLKENFRKSQQTKITTTEYQQKKDQPKNSHSQNRNHENRNPESRNHENRNPESRIKQEGLFPNDVNLVEEASVKKDTTSLQKKSDKAVLEINTKPQKQTKKNKQVMKVAEKTKRKTT